MPLWSSKFEAVNSFQLAIILMWSSNLFDTIELIEEYLKFKLMLHFHLKMIQSNLLNGQYRQVTSHDLKWFMCIPARKSLINKFSLPYSGMEHVWLQEFSKLFIQFLPHSWYIMPVEVAPRIEDPPIPEDCLYSFFDSAKVRFCCEVSVIFKLRTQIFYWLNSFEFQTLWLECPQWGFLMFDLERRSPKLGVLIALESWKDSEFGSQRHFCKSCVLKSIFSADWNELEIGDKFTVTFNWQRAIN